MLPPSGPLQPTQKALPSPSPRDPAPALPRRPGPSPPPGLRGAAESPEATRAPRLTLGGEEWRLTRVVHGAHAARRGNGSFGVLRQEPGLHSGSLPKLPDLALAPRPPERGNRLSGGGLLRETGSAEGQNSPHALLSQRHRGWPRPWEGRGGGSLTRCSRLRPRHGRVPLGSGPSSPSALPAVGPRGAGVHSQP